MNNGFKTQLEAYAAGRLSRIDLQESTGMNFFDVLEGLGTIGLKLPRVDTTKYYNEAQMEIYNKLFKLL